MLSRENQGLALLRSYPTLSLSEAELRCARHWKPGLSGCQGSRLVQCCIHPWRLVDVLEVMNLMGYKWRHCVPIEHRRRFRFIEPWVQVTGSCWLRLAGRRPRDQGHTVRRGQGPEPAINSSSGPTETLGPDKCRDLKE